MTRRSIKLSALSIGLMAPTAASAKYGSVDYSWGADALAKCHDYVVTMMLYVNYLLSAVAGIVALISAFQIFFKMNSGEDGIAKEIMMLVGAVLFFIGATTVFPALFGYNLN